MKSIAIFGTWGLYFSTHATIEELTIYPTAEQAVATKRERVTKRKRIGGKNQLEN